MEIDADFTETDGIENHVIEIVPEGEKSPLKAHSRSGYLTGASIDRTPRHAFCLSPHAS
jgi:hypothetical protein